MKRIISALLAVVICFSLSVPAFAADGAAEPEKKSLKECLFSIYTGAQAERISSEIALKAEYWPGIFENGVESVWVGIRISDNPELANPKVFRKTVVKMVDRSETFIESPSEITQLLGYHRFGGELALHIFALMILDAFKGLGIPDYDALYEMFDYAEMDIDEDRISPLLMKLVGVIIMGLFP